MSRLQQGGNQTILVILAAAAATTTITFVSFSISIIIMKRQQQKQQQQSLNNTIKKNKHTTKTNNNCSSSGGGGDKTKNNNEKKKELFIQNEQNQGVAKENEYEWSNHLPDHIRLELHKEKKRKEKLPMIAMKSQMYDNITMVCPKGEHLTQISLKKAKWYVNKNLAIWKTTMKKKKNDNDQDTNEHKFIQLTFEPKSKSDQNDYGKSIKQNICHACGCDNHDKQYQMRFYIVPHVYRTLFPKRYKNHMSHDVILLCSDCHLQCTTATCQRMNEIEEMFHPQKRFIINQEQYKVRSSALALLNWKHQIPKDKIHIHEDIVRTYFKIGGDHSLLLSKHTEDEYHEEPLTKELLQKIIDVDYKIENPNYVPGPELVVNSIVNDDVKMADFIRGWRRFFIDTIHPRHLPQGWSVDYPIACDEKVTV